MARRSNKSSNSSRGGKAGGSRGGNTGGPRGGGPGSKRKRKSGAGRVARIIAGLIGAIALITVVFVAVIELTPMSLSELQTTPNETVVYDKNGAVFMKIGNSVSTLTYNQIPKNVRDAVVATEDHNFYTGSSIDVKSLLRSLFVDLLTRHATQGGSTIQEQLAKIVYLNDDKSISYKIKEIVMGVKIDKYFTKQEILAMYLDRVFLGENSVGVQQAAMRYFGVNIATNPNALTLDQAALLAGLPQAPSAYDPLKHPEAAKTRRNQVLENMAKYGYITEATAKTAEAKPLGVSYHGVPGDSWDTNPLFTNFLFDYAAKNGITAQQLLSGGLNVYTTIDAKVQKAVNTVFWSTNYNGDFPGPTSGKVVEGGAIFVDPSSGGVLGAAGSREQDYTAFGQDRVYANSSPGSSIKPIIDYAPAIESGKWTPTSVLDNQSQDFGGGYTPSNWEGANGPSKVTLQYALQWSQNIASVWLLQQIGLNTGIQFAQKDGIQFTANDKQHLGVAIGGMDKGVNPYEMVQAYEPFANGGVQQKVHLINRIVTQTGQTVYQFQPSSLQVMSSATARVMTGLLQDVVDFGTGTRAQVSGWGVAGKTGTVQYSPGLNSDHPNWIRDAWFDGYTPNMVGSVYIGYDIASPTNHMTMSPLDPSANAAAIFGDITRLAVQGEQPQQFSVGPYPASNGTADAATKQPGIQGLSASWDASANGVALSWQSNLSGATGYTITRSGGPSGGSGSAAGGTSGSGTSGTGGNGGSSSGGAANTSGPGGASGGTSGGGAGTGSAGGSSGPVTLGQTANTTFTDSNVLPGYTYTYAVQAVDAGGKPVGQPATVSFTVPGQSAPPSNPSNTVGGTGTNNSTSNATGGTSGSGGSGSGTGSGTSGGGSGSGGTGTGNTTGGSSSGGSGTSGNSTGTTSGTSGNSTGSGTSGSSGGSTGTTGTGNTTGK